MQNVRIAQIKGKEWKKQLLNYLFCYRITPHSIMSIAPTEALMGCKLGTELPCLRHKAVLDEKLRDADNLNKMKWKYCEQRDAKPVNIKVVDKVSMH